MVGGSDEDPKVSGKPDYDGSLKQWRSVKISLRSYLHVKQKLQVVQHGVSNKATANKDTHGTHTISELSNFETPATRLAPLITSSIKAHKASIQWYIYVQDTSIFIGDTDLQPSLAGRSLGPYTAAQVMDMTINESSSIDNDFSATLYSVRDIDCDSPVELIQQKKEQKKTTTTTKMMKKLRL